MNNILLQVPGEQMMGSVLLDLILESQVRTRQVVNNSEGLAGNTKV